MPEEAANLLYTDYAGYLSHEGTESPEMVGKVSERINLVLAYT